MTQQAVIIGAGIAGLISARRLQKQGWQVTLLEKSKGYGGRLATRRIGEAVFDHGAQAFTVHSIFFRSLTEQMQDEGLVKDWCRGFLNADRQLSLDGYLRFYAVQGMSSLAKYVGRELDIRLHEKVLGLRSVSGRWQVMCESGLQLEADAVILTPPLPQALQLVKKIDNLGLTPEIWERLHAVKYDPCLAVMAVLDGPSGLPEPGGLASTDPMSPIKWIADNRQKGISSQEAVTIHGTAHFSRSHWKTEREAAGQKLWQAAQGTYIQANALELQTHGWRYAQVTNPLESNSLMLNQSPPLLLAGDAFGSLQHPIEGAALSGLDAAQKLLKL